MNLDKVFIIAEAGVNHNGQLTTAKKLVDAAIDAGADCIKFQTWITEEIIDFNAPKAHYQSINDGNERTQYQMLKELELSFNDFRAIKKYCDEKKILFLSTPDEKNSLDFLVDSLKIPIIKVGSGEVNNILFLRQIAQKNLPVILSTGMCTIDEVKKAYDILILNGAPEVSILHCTSDYPAPYESVNLKVLETFKNMFNTTIGYSDHTDDIEVSIAAVCFGAKIIEKHFTLNKEMKGPDHKASLDPIELKKMIKSIRNVEKAIGNGIKKPYHTEYNIKKIIQKGLYANRDLNIGDEIKIDDLVGKRPVQIESIDQADKYIGKIVVSKINKGEPISPKNIK